MIQRHPRRTRGPVARTAFFILAALIVAAAPLGRSSAQAAAGQPAASETTAQLDAEAALARQRVTEIINQPVSHLPRTDAAGVFSPGWFHAGAEKPDFNTVDVRTTQSFPYDGYSYVTSDVTPSEMFIGHELEFNAMTKYFYVDRSLPKKRLTDAEMVEINRLYRIIGRDERADAVRNWEIGGAGVLAVILGVSLFALFRRMV